MEKFIVGQEVRLYNSHWSREYEGVILSLSEHAAVVRLDNGELAKLPYSVITPKG